jgi:magnesium transporter
MSETIARSGTRHIREFRDPDGVVAAPFLAAVREALAATDKVRLLELAGDVHEADLGALLAALDADTRQQLIALLGAVFDYTALTQVDDSLREEMLEALTAEAVARGVRDLDSDDADYLLKDLSPQDQKDVLRHDPAVERVPLERGLRYPAESAGRLMQTEFIAVPPDWDVGNVIDHLREDRDLPDTFYELYVVEPDGRLVGAVRLDRLLRTMRPVKIVDVLVEDPQIVRAQDDQESAARRFERYDLVSAPGVDVSDRLVGVLTADDVLDVIEEEAEEDLRALAGVRRAEDLSDTVMETARLRLPWLVLNLITAFIAAGVIAWFEATIEAVVAVAILMPVNAALGGNSGTQALAVAVRALATEELNRSNMVRIILREAQVGVVNGAVLAVLAGAAAGWAFGSVTIGAVLSSAMILTVIFGTTVGILVPILVSRAKIDPALASGVIVLTVADVFGFFIFLAFATVAFEIG